MKKKIQLKRQDKFMDSGWLELVEKKGDFLRILEVMNRYYKSNMSENYPSESSRFRENLLNTPPENFKIFIKRFGNFEYFIAAELSMKEGTRFDSWIHIDGIEEEKKELKQRKINDHPIFEIISLTDLFMNCCKKIDSANKPLEKFVL